MRAITLIVILCAAACGAAPKPTPEDPVRLPTKRLNAKLAAVAAREAALASDADYLASRNVAALIQAWDLSKVTDAKTKAALESLKALLAQTERGKAKDKAIDDEKDKAKQTRASAEKPK